MVNGARIFIDRLQNPSSESIPWIKGGNYMKPIMNLHDIDVTEFLAVLDTCEGNVFLVTNEGDRLNLKSKHLLWKQEWRKQAFQIQLLRRVRGCSRRITNGFPISVELPLFLITLIHVFYVNFKTSKSEEGSLTSDPFSVRPSASAVSAALDRV